ncbi:hypothetical protein BHE74_00024466 [Ensete ventricosum]|nr:hypothetical protein BHE74_00024466 [Ensete ventricosum]RZR83510.1 hypothetical protein BHM03_00010140 [Ensete ventricosum]
MGMDSHRKLDSLTAHIALYHSASSKISNPNPSPRAAVLRWFSGLTVAHRQSALTVGDAEFLRVLLQMLSRLRRRGHGFFFLLPDLPSPSLPSLCFRRSDGLLSRAAAADAAERTVADSLLLFASSDDPPLLDAATVAEDLVSDIDRFVAVMDAISGGRFLRGEANGLAAPWAEMPWLKDKGYYSLEAFVANRLEVALRLSWLSSQGGKKLKGGKAAKEKALTAGLAANAFWRKKGCLDWWAGLDPGGRKKIFEAFLGKAAKSLKSNTGCLKGKKKSRSSGKPRSENIGDSFECKSHNSKKRSGRRRAKTKSKISSSMKVGRPDLEDKRSDLSSLAVDIERKEAIDPLDGLSGPATVAPLSNGSAIISDPSPVDNSCEPYDEPGLMDENVNTRCMKKDHDLHNTINHYVTGWCFSKSSDRSEVHYECKCDSQSVNTLEVVPQMSMTNSLICCDETSANSADPSIKCLENENKYQVSNLSLPMPEPSIKGRSYDWPETKINNSENLCEITSQFVAPSIKQEGFANDDGSVIQNDSKTCYSYNQTNTFEGKSYEWPVIAPHNFSSFNSQHVPAATERLHLDVGHEWPAYRHQSFLCSRHQARLPSNEGGCNHILPSLTLPMSFDWPPMVKSCSRLSQTVTVSYDSGYNSRLQSSYCTGFSGHAVQNTGNFSENDRIHTGDILDVYDMKNMSDLAEDTESYWLSEEEIESHMLSGRDYNQFFGGGVMYWNPAEHVGSGFSRPPSHSSDDSGWAWHEADLNRAIDDMVGMPGLSASYNSNGLASPTATQFCSPFDTVGSGHQSVGYAVSGNDITGKVINSSSVSDIPEEKAPKSMNNSPSVIEGVKGDTLPFSMLRPIIVPSMSRRGSRSEFKLGYEHKSPCVPSSRRDVPQIKRPPSPVVLCVPRVPRPPPPSPVGESRKRGFPIVRSGSSSPRHWGVRFSDESGSEESRCCFDGAEVVWPSWGNKVLTTNPMVRSIHGPLLTDHLITIPQLAFDKEHVSKYI